ncbi:MAG: AraC family transcriptional regulator [Planctomycetes bacterium]|nr:AraC family transcriptional regulator [Planctomycetota bacterium]
MATKEMATLASAIERQTLAEGAYETAVPALRLFRFSAPSDLVGVVYEPCLCVVAQGAKEVLLADERWKGSATSSVSTNVRWSRRPR